MRKDLRTHDARARPAIMRFSFRHMQKTHKMWCHSSEFLFKLLKLRNSTKILIFFFKGLWLIKGVAYQAVMGDGAANLVSVFFYHRSPGCQCGTEFCWLYSFHQGKVVPFFNKVLSFMHKNEVTIFSICQKWAFFSNHLSWNSAFEVVPRPSHQHNRVNNVICRSAFANSSY